MVEEGSVKGLRCHTARFGHSCGHLESKREVLRGKGRRSDTYFKKASGGSVKNACPVARAKAYCIDTGKRWSRQSPGMEGNQPRG